MERLPLLGVPVALKDNLCARGQPATAGSRLLQHFVPPYDATVVERLEAAGAVVLGKTNCDEFGMGSSTENSAFGPTRNPWRLDCTPGGSSGGSAAAVAGGLAPVALGSDTGGSIRQPAALCGVFGLRPTWGRVSRYGLIAFASSLDQIGPLARTADDAALVLGTIAGHDPRDATSVDAPVPDYAAALTGDVRLRLAVPRRSLEGTVDDEVAAAFSAALDVLRGRGATVVEIDLPHAAQAMAVYYVLVMAEASSNLARYDGVRYGTRVPAAGDPALDEMYRETRSVGFGAEVTRRVMLGTYVLSAGYYDAYYRKAQQARTLIARDYAAAFAGADAVLTPTSPTAAFRLGERVDDPVAMYRSDVLTVGPSLADLPAASVPCGFTAAGLPLGLQIVGRLDEPTVLRVADAYQRDSRWHTLEPVLPGATGPGQRS